ncbi:antibiotic biosynthesis monooxygenase family protein [Morganella psychrotolerans]|uniref:Monooxygenase n=1 Tax=Morganella psychrotolerans TaxID=368603 RepID=A0A1B8H7X9_9GAMM|nr:antibiotic biosynthesis monooxygenase [Morganella psychrotolerans]OBU05177.1 monooxygenase [Morganella psychrotolerans]
MFAVIFEVSMPEEKQSRYLEIAATLRPLLEDAEGFISIERFQSLSTPGKLLSLSLWEDEASLLKWKQNQQHQLAQQEGKADIFSFYRIRIAEIGREYTFTREDQ